MGLKWEDIDLEAGMLRVRRALASDTRTLVQPKTVKARRGVRLTSSALEALKEHQERQLNERQKLDGLWRDYGLVFPSRVGTPLNSENLVKRSFKPLLKRVGPPPIRFHDLRHTCATLLLSEGVNPKIVQEMLDTPIFPSRSIPTATSCRTYSRSLWPRWMTCFLRTGCSKGPRPRAGVLLRPSCLCCKCGIR